MNVLFSYKHGAQGEEPCALYGVWRLRFMQFPLHHGVDSYLCE